MATMNTRPDHPNPNLKTNGACPPSAHAASRPWRRLAALALPLLLAACASRNPQGLDIDQSVQAKSQNSRVSTIVLHYTSANNDASLRILSERNVSAHYLVTDERKPHVYQLVDESRRAWHAGVSEWYGRSDLNSTSIGIEIVNQGLMSDPRSGHLEGPHADQWDDYSAQQLRTLTTLLKDIMARHQIKPENIVGHSDVAPQRKIDPGPLFPWRALADQGVGRWYDETLARQYAAQFLLNGLPPLSWVQAELRRVGYTAPNSGILDKATINTLGAFQMHYRPVRYDGRPDAETLGILKALP